MSDEIPEYKKLDELLSLTRENNRILRKMHRGMIWGQVVTFIYWLIVLGVMGWSYYYFQPYFAKYISSYQKAVKTLDSIQKESSGVSGNIQMMINGMQ